MEKKLPIVNEFTIEDFIHADQLKNPLHPPSPHHIPPPKNPTPPPSPPSNLPHPVIDQNYL